ncbi:hypothetical protein G7021_13055 [Pseudomonas carnis]|uniref:hypothetical protein n=1 Tax=Pseudomonas TaxID=286 RepID=UPI00112CD8C2|nr:MULTISPECIES: hypothetical protein [Pseudomonas]MBA1253571.1 hypothetical protein [Pseudomonas carnis]MBA1267637.1 hypothetical protein [Pseudomonas carnis]MCP9735163.1 hypothetical protein [Pseudomonas sp. GBPI_506]TPV60190.1 hypothetical protein FJ692_03330 [Pseudomonas fluorescens]
MSKVLNFPTPAPVEIINEAHFEKFDEAALLLMCFEVAADAVEAVSDGDGITERDCSHVGLMEVCMALAVMFRRRTGHEVQQVSADHFAHERKVLMEGEEFKSLPIPIRPPALSPLPTAAFSALSTADLAQVGFNYMSRSHEHIKGNCPKLIELDLARAHSLDAMGALVVLIERLSGGVTSNPASETPIANAPGSETLQ